MTPLLSLILLILIAYIGTIFFQRAKSAGSLLLKGITDSGIIYLVLGFLIGPNVLQIINKNVLENISLMLSFVLGWTGFLIGLQISLKQMLRFPVNYYWRALSNFCLTFLIILIGLILIQEFIGSNFNYMDLLILSTAASINSPFFIGLIKIEFKIKGKLIHFMQFHSAYDNMLGVVITGIVLMSVQTLSGRTFTGSIINLIISSSIVIILSLIFFLMTKDINSISQYFLIILGFILFLVGMALYLGQSALFISFIFGLVLANLPIKTWKLFQTIVKSEKPIYLLLVIFMGASLSNINNLIIIFTIILSFWRIAGKYLSGRLTLNQFDHEKNFSSIIGLSGIGIGGLSLALGLDFHISVITNNSGMILNIIAFLYIINDTISLKIVKPFMGKDGKNF